MSGMQASDGLDEYNTVRVRSLDGARIDGCGLGCRSPEVGDTGAVVSVLSTGDDTERMFLVECVQEDGLMAWIAAFPGSGLERIASAGSES